MERQKQKKKRNIKMLEKDETIALELSRALITAIFRPGIGTQKSPADAVKTYREMLAELKKNR
jgi:hypothetical protein